ncbi:MAG: hypothetical protein WEB87_05775 [Bacteriovoracaceae bacterium]
MKYFVYFFVLYAGLGFNAVMAKNSNIKNLESFFQENWKLNKNSIEHLTQGNILSEADVNSEADWQEFSLKAAGWHNKKCSLVLRKLSMLENYQEWISFIKSSTYQEKNRLFTLKADHTLLPYPMLVHIIMDRPNKEGVYDFAFPTGIFAGLKGRYHIRQIKNRCLIYTDSYWKGKKTNIPNLVIELFSETLSKRGAELLMRKTQF